jgi:hypothetical protein
MCLWRTGAVHPALNRKRLPPEVIFAFHLRPSAAGTTRTCRSETITIVFGNKRIACAVLGFWLGAGVCIDILATQNLAAVDRFMADPGSPHAAMQIRQAGQVSVRFLLARNAAEENAWIFAKWEWAEIGIGIAFFFQVMLGERPPHSAVVLIPAMLLIVLVQLSILTPHIASLSTEVDEIPAFELPGNQAMARFQAFRGIYAGGEILKIVLGIGLASRLAIRRETVRSSKGRVTDKTIAAWESDRRYPDRRSAQRRSVDRNPNG